MNDNAEWYPIYKLITKKHLALVLKAQFTHKKTICDHLLTLKLPV